MYQGCWGFFYIDMTHFVGGAPHHVRDLPPPVGGAPGELVGCLGQFGYLLVCPLTFLRKIKLQFRLCSRKGKLSSSNCLQRASLICNLLLTQFDKCQPLKACRFISKCLKRKIRMTSLTLTLICLYSWSSSPECLTELLQTTASASASLIVVGFRATSQRGFDFSSLAWTETRG